MSIYVYEKETAARYCILRRGRARTSAYCLIIANTNNSDRVITFSGVSALESSAQVASCTVAEGNKLLHTNTYTLFIVYHDYSRYPLLLTRTFYICRFWYTHLGGSITCIYSCIMNNEDGRWDATWTSTPNTNLGCGSKAKGT